MTKNFNNLQIAELLRQVAASYKLRDEKKNKFKIIAYEKASDAVEHATSELKDLWDDGKLEEVPGIGPSIAKHLEDIFKNGSSKHFEEIMKDVPADAFKLMALPKVGIKTAVKLIREAPKEELAEKLTEAEKIINKVKRHLLPYAMEIAVEVIEWMKKDKNTLKIDPLGSLRRKVATVGDIDIAVATPDAVKTINHFVNYPKKQQIIEKGERTASILLPGNIQVDVLPTLPENYGSALQHFTGSKFHNIALREYSLKKGYSLNEYRIKDVKKNKDITIDNELDFYKFLGLNYIEPEMREGTGEIEASLNNNLPELVKLDEIKGDLQIHSDFDIETSHDVGSSSMEEIINVAEKLNYQYLAFTEHNPSKKGHTDEDIVKLLKKKREKIEQINSSSKIFVFNSLEIDIGKEGDLPVPDEGLETLDFALVSIHSSFELDRDAMTERVLKALSHPKVKIFAHPTARKINEREGVELDWDKIFNFCLKNNKWIEINADPMRLDLPDVLVREAVKKGVKLSMGTDSHDAQMLHNMKWGINVARRGWAQKKDIINCLTLKEINAIMN